MEVNSSPALDLDNDVDVTVKTQLINDTLDLLALHQPHKQPKHSRRTSDISHTSFTLPDLPHSKPRKGDKSAHIALERATVDCSLSYDKDYRETKGKRTLSRRKLDITEVERALLTPHTQGKVEELTRSRPVFLPSEGRPNSCGLYELICPLTPVFPI